MKLWTFTISDVKFVFSRFELRSKNSNFIRTSFRPMVSEFVLTLTVRLQYFIQHGFHVIVLKFGASSHLFSLIY